MDRQDLLLGIAIGGLAATAYFLWKRPTVIVPVQPQPEEPSPPTPITEYLSGRLYCGFRTGELPSYTPPAPPDCYLYIAPGTKVPLYADTAVKEKLKSLNGKCVVVSGHWITGGEPPYAPMVRWGFKVAAAQELPEEHCGFVRTGVII